MTTTALASIAAIGGFAALGFLIGAVCFVTLRVNATLYLAGGALWKPVVLNLVRLGVTVGGFVLIAQAGALALLMALAGLLLARSVTIRLLGRAA